MKPTATHRLYSNANTQHVLTYTQTSLDQTIAFLVERVSVSTWSSEGKLTTMPITDSLNLTDTKEAFFSGAAY